MVRKAPATTKHKGSQKNETYMPGITEATDMIQQMGDLQGIALDEGIAKAVREKSVSEVMDTPIGGLNNDIAAPVNTE
ncbi:hypothetical protein Tfer_2421 [Thermincola ferriacetica]|uniref:Uncharacterized protein n=1 Tax=Thermincola ferriacetica TaxID=281456 RepID=A0A0L6W046_9FIRM|nr:hypothetical protein [Thermincola ferriacetica]KNZ68932.1 hypothetical protein Tfer_2421 [Thermincola ferriacetica]